MKNRFYLALFILSFAGVVHAEKISTSTEPVIVAGVRVEKAKEKIRKAAEPIEKTAKMAGQEVKEIAAEAHSLGGKILQGIINVMTAASPGKTRVYLPAPSSDPNTGLTVGMLPVFLWVDKKEEIRHIFAPSITYNKIFKMNSTLRYYWYPRPGAQFFTLGSYAQSANRRFALRYEDPHFFNEHFYFKFDFNAQSDGSMRFYGFGPRTTPSHQYNYTLQNEHLQVHTGLNFWQDWRLTLTHRLRWAQVVDGPIDSLARITRFPTPLIGVEDHQRIVAQRWTLDYNTKDQEMAPTAGYHAKGFYEYAPLGGNSKLERWGVETRGYHSAKQSRYITAWRALFEGVTGNNIPFYEQSLLGGKDSLRGFGESRFIDRYKFVYGVEERIRVYTLKAFNVNIDFEVTPFYEAGTVFYEPRTLEADTLHHVYGVGFRSVVRPNVVGIIDIGFGDDGTALFVGIDYPF